MAAGVSEFMVEGMVVVLVAMEGVGRGDADDIIRGRVAGGKSRVVDRAEPGIFPRWQRPFHMAASWFD